MLQQTKRSALSFNEIVFEHRNKTYGAFELRRSLERHQFIAFIISSTILLLIVGGIFLNGLSSPVEFVKFNDPICILKTFDFETNIEKVEPEKPASQPKNDAGRNDLKKDDLVMVPVKDPIKTDEKQITNVATDSLAYNKDGAGKPGEVLPGNGKGDGDDFGKTPGSSGNSGSEIKDIVEINPEFPGGIENMYKYLSNNLRYPSYLRERRVSGTVFVSFVINTKGDINDVEILKSPNDGFNEEVVRVINNMPKWKPGIQSGKNVSVRFKMPIKFTLK